MRILLCEDDENLGMLLREYLQAKGFNAEGYDFKGSAADIDGRIVGLMLDEVNRPDLTDTRIAEWVKSLKQ